MASLTVIWLRLSCDQGVCAAQHSLEATLDVQHRQHGTGCSGNCCAGHQQSQHATVSQSRLIYSIHPLIHIEFPVPNTTYRIYQLHMGFSGPKYNVQWSKQILFKIINSWNVPSAQLPVLAVREVGLGGCGRAPHGGRRVGWLGIATAPGHGTTSSALYPPSWSPFQAHNESQNCCDCPRHAFYHWQHQDT